MSQKYQTCIIILVHEATSQESKIRNMYYYICIEFIIKEILMVSICLISLLVTEAKSQRYQTCVLLYMY